MSLFLRIDSPCWWGLFYHPITGERIRESTKRPHLLGKGAMVYPTRPSTPQRKARDLAERVVNDQITAILDQDQFGRQEEITIRDALNWWLETITAEGNRDLRNPTSRVKKLLGDPPFTGRYSLKGELAWNSLTTADLEALKRQRLREGNSKGTINHELAVLSGTNTRLQKANYKTNPELRFELYKTVAKWRALEADEVQSILDLIEVQQSHDIAVTLLDTGARLGEVLPLMWQDIHMNRKSISIFRPKVQKTTEIRMSPRVEHLMDLRFHRPHRYSCPFVFPSKDHKGHQVGLKHLRRAIDQSGVNEPLIVKRRGKASIHSFRDTFATNALSAGVPLAVVQEILGHATPQMTQKYARLRPGVVLDAMDNYFGGS